MEKGISLLSNLLPVKQDTSLLSSHSLIALSLVSSWLCDSSLKWLCPLWKSVPTLDVFLGFSLSSPNAFVSALSCCLSSQGLWELHQVCCCKSLTMLSAAYEFDFSSWKNEVGETRCALVQPCFHIDFNVLPVRQLPVRGNWVYKCTRGGEISQFFSACDYFYVCWHPVYRNGDFKRRWMLANILNLLTPLGSQSNHPSSFPFPRFLLATFPFL